MFDLNRRPILWMIARRFRSNMYIPVYHTNRRPFKNMIGVVKNRPVGMGLKRPYPLGDIAVMGNRIGRRRPILAPILSPITLWVWPKMAGRSLGDHHRWATGDCRPISRMFDISIGWWWPILAPIFLWVWCIYWATGRPSLGDWNRRATGWPLTYISSMFDISLSTPVGGQFQ